MHMFPQFFSQRMMKVVVFFYFFLHNLESVGGLIMFHLDVYLHIYILAV